MKLLLKAPRAVGSRNGAQVLLSFMFSMSKEHIAHLGPAVFVVNPGCLPRCLMWSPLLARLRLLRGCRLCASPIFRGTTSLRSTSLSPAASTAPSSGRSGHPQLLAIAATAAVLAFSALNEPIHLILLQIIPPVVASLCYSRFL